MSFFVVQVQSSFEINFKKLLIAALEKSDTEKISIHVPQRKLSIRRRGKTREEQKPIFPGYVFINAEEYSAALLKAIREIPCFAVFLPDNRSPQPLNKLDQEIIKKLLSNGEIITKSKVSFDENNTIQVIQGPLKGLEGKIVKVDKRKGRAKIQLSLYKNDFFIDFGFDDIACREKNIDR